VLHYFNYDNVPFGFLGIVQKELEWCIEVSSSHFGHIPQVTKELTAREDVEGQRSAELFSKYLG